MEAPGAHALEKGCERTLSECVSPLRKDVLDGVSHDSVAGASGRTASICAGQKADDLRTCLFGHFSMRIVTGVVDHEGCAVDMFGDPLPFGSRVLKTGILCTHHHQCWDCHSPKFFFHISGAVDHSLERLNASGPPANWL